jgi:adenosine deaminase
MVSKAELHVHLEGTMRPTVAKQLAKKNRLDFPEKLLGSNETYRCEDFNHFLRAYQQVSELLRCDEDYSFITYDYLARCAEQQAIYIEMMCAPDLAAMNQVNYQQLIAGMADGIDRAKKDFGLDARILVTIVRHLSIQHSFAMVEQALENPHPYVVGLGMAGDEINHPAKRFAEIFQLAHENGLQCTAHGGEVMGAESVWQVIRYLPVTRVGHGVRAIDDPQLIEQLIQRNITLEVCPSSNVALGVYPSLAEHPLKQLFDAGVKVCLNSDDPPFFGTTLGNEYAIAQQHFGFTEAQLNQITLNAIHASFADEALKKTLHDRLLRNGSKP